jgi:hypothetical protein
MAENDLVLLLLPSCLALAFGHETFPEAATVDEADQRSLRRLDDKRPAVNSSPRTATRLPQLHFPSPVPRGALTDSSATAGRRRRTLLSRRTLVGLITTSCSGGAHTAARAFDYSNATSDHLSREISDSNQSGVKAKPSGYC